VRWGCAVMRGGCHSRPCQRLATGGAKKGGDCCGCRWAVAGSVEQQWGSPAHSKVRPLGTARTSLMRASVCAVCLLCWHAAGFTAEPPTHWPTGPSWSSRVACLTVASAQTGPRWCWAGVPAGRWQQAAQQERVSIQRVQAPAVAAPADRAAAVIANCVMCMCGTRSLIILPRDSHASPGTGDARG
jgi:hypothetical protein